MDKRLKLSDMTVKAEDCIDPADYVMVHKDYLARLQRKDWKCKAQPTADPPQDCGWPDCGCDPNIEKIIDGLQECGYTITPPGGTHSAPTESK